MNELSLSTCAYELCKRTESIESIPGHRRKLYHDDSCRQAQHRLLEARVLFATLRQLWTDYLPATQHVLEDILRQQGEARARSVAAAIAAERKQARHPALSEDERAVLKGQWSDLQRGTQQILESLLNSGRGDPSTFFHLILLAINEERRHALCNSEQDQRVADLEIKVSAYCQIIDLDDRAKLLQQFLAIGQLLDYRAIPKFRIAAGLQAWEDYRSWTYEDTLADVIVYAREVLSEEKAARELAENRSKVRQMERALTAAQSDLQELRQRVQDHQTAPVPALLAIQAYFHMHPGASLPLQRGSHLFQLTALRTDGVAVATGEGLITLSPEEIHQLGVRTGTMILDPCQDTSGQDMEIEHKVDREHQAMQARLYATGERLHYRRLLAIPQINAGIESWQSFIASASYEQVCQAVKTAEHYYENLTYLDELEQRSRQAAQEKQQQKSRPRQVEQELVAAQAEIQKLQRELTRYLSPPRALLECTLRQWTMRTKLLFQDQELTGDLLDTFLQQSTDRKLLSYSKWGESCYFHDKYRRRRIACIQRHLATAEPYQGDPALQMKSMDDQGYVTFGDGHRSSMDTDGINRFWARIVREQGQRMVGGNANLAPIQQYLSDHPGRSIEIRRDKDTQQIVVVDDDAQAVTETTRPIRFSEDDIEQARCWIREQS